MQGLTSAAPAAPHHDGCSLLSPILCRTNKRARARCSGVARRGAAWRHIFLNGRQIVALLRTATLLMPCRPAASSRRLTIRATANNKNKGSKGGNAATTRKAVQ